MKYSPEKKNCWIPNVGKQPPKKNASVGKKRKKRQPVKPNGQNAPNNGEKNRNAEFWAT